MKCARASCTRPARPGKTKCEECAEFARQYYQRNRVYYPQVSKRYYLKKNFGLSLEDYNQQFEEQKGLCACCGQSETITRRGKVIRLAVDHNHVTGTNRGLLCWRCNRIFGMFKDNIDLFYKAIEYLTRWGTGCSVVT